MSKDVPLCRIPECGRPAANRGLCRSCYAGCRLRVVAGKCTWEALQCAGVCDAAKKVRRSRFLGKYLDLVLGDAGKYGVRSEADESAGKQETEQGKDAQ